MSLNPAAIEKRIVALATSNPSLTQKQIAQHVGRSTKTVQRALKANAGVVEQAQNDLLGDMQSAFSILQSAEDAALNYVELATAANNESVKLNAQDKILELRGVITEKERRRLDKEKDQAERDITINIVHVGSPSPADTSRFCVSAIDIEVK